MPSAGDHAPAAANGGQQPPKPVTIAFVLYPGFTALDIIGPFEVLAFVPGHEAVFVAAEPGPVTDDTGRCQLIASASLDVEVMIWATGYRPDYSWIDIPGVTRDGKAVHRRGVTEVPGLYFLGLSWQHTRGSALLGFVHDDAAYLAGRITSHAQSATAAASRPAPQGSA